jgi:hypothetical protein
MIAAGCVLATVSNGAPLNPDLTKVEPALSGQYATYDAHGHCLADHDFIAFEFDTMKLCHGIAPLDKTLRTAAGGTSRYPFSDWL